MRIGSTFAVTGIALAAIVMAGPAAAVTIPWIAASGDWNEGGNWNGGAVPGNDDEAHIANGGTVFVTSNITPINRLRVATSATSSGWYVQTGGSMTISTAFGLGQHGDDTSRSYGEATISGGTLTTNQTINVGNGQGLFRIIGSAATITAHQGFRASNTDRKDLAVLEFVLDNSTAHITTIRSTNSSAFRNGTLSIGLNGGVLLTGTNQFTLMQAQGEGAAFRTDTNNGKFVAPDYLWTTTQNSSVTQVTLDPEDFKGTLDASSAAGVVFDPSNYGFIDLANASGTSLQLGLDLDGPVNNFKTALTDAGVSWSPASGEYDVILNLNPSVSGGSHFAWDLSRIDPSLEVRSIGVVPEPAFAGWLILAGAAMVRRRARF